MSLEQEEPAKPKQLRHSDLGFLVPRYLVAIICGPESMTGFLLCKFAKIDGERSNYFIVDKSKFVKHMKSSL